MCSFLAVQEDDRNGLKNIVDKLTNQIEDLTEEMFGEANGKCQYRGTVRDVKRRANQQPLHISQRE